MAGAALVQMVVQRVVQRCVHERFAILTPAWGKESQAHAQEIEASFYE